MHRRRQLSTADAKGGRFITALLLIFLKKLNGLR
jgi:hypothetical protein